MKTKEEIQQIIDSMSDAQKAGQLFLLAYPGENPQVITPIMEQYGVCGCYISADNATTFEKAREISERLQSMSTIPLLLGVDQEGAWGVLIPSSTPGPGNMALCASNDASSTQTIYNICGSEMLSAGYNSILGPCSDINTNPASPIIGVRSFGQEPHRVATHVVSAVKGLQEAGSVSCLKHFPGHGSTEGDTHREIPQVHKTLEQLRKEDLIPFKAGIEAGCDMIMTSHILYPEIDKDAPATLSSKILNGLLREELQFKGVILSDSMNMGAIRKTYDAATSTLLALQAGVDVVMLSEEHYDYNKDSYLEKQLQSLSLVEKAITDGTLSKELVNEKLIRILTLKFNKMKVSTPPLDSTEMSKNKELAIEIAQDAILIAQQGMVEDIALHGKGVCINATKRSAYENMVNERGIGPNQSKAAFDSFKEELSSTKDVTFLEQDEIKGLSDKSLLQEASIIYVVSEGLSSPWS